MKKLTAVILSLCLVLCSCGKVNDPILKRELIDQTKTVAPQEQADETSPEDKKKTVTVGKTIPINYLGENLKKIGETSVNDIEGLEGKTTVSINNFKDTIPEDTCDIIDAWYWKDGIDKTLTKNLIHLDEVDRIELVCWDQLGNHGPTPSPEEEKDKCDIVEICGGQKSTPSPAPEPTPTPTETPQSSLTPSPPSPSATYPKTGPEPTKISREQYVQLGIVYVGIPILVIYIIYLFRDS
jgi:hypothetical protein